LSPGKFPWWSPFPVNGIIKEPYLLIPLVCQDEEKHTPIINVWFIVSTAFPYTFISKTTMESLYGPGNVYNSVGLRIQAILSMFDNYNLY
jgi:hypothetical protein